MSFKDLLNPKPPITKPFQSFVFIDTEFKRSSEPVFVLAACDYKRYINFDIDLRAKPLHEQITHIQKIIRQHYIDTDGDIGIWGAIKRYVFFYNEGEKVALTTDGAILNPPDDVRIGKATLSVNNKDISPMLRPN